jgi:hypothetical protein
MTIATLLAFLCTANAANLVRERTQQLHKSAAASTGARLWTQEEDPFRRLAVEGSMSLSMSMAADSSMSIDMEEIPEVDEGDREAESGWVSSLRTVRNAEGIAISLLRFVFVLFQWINCVLMPLLDSYHLLKQILYNSAMTIGTTVSALAAAGAMMFL